MTRLDLALAIPLLLLASAATAGTKAQEPPEHRIYPHEVTASSFLWTEANRFLENYHPNYAFDDDPATAWVEADAGASSKLVMKLDALEATRRIRLRIRNGDHTNVAARGATSRAKEIELRALPSGERVQVTLDDRAGWQDVILPIQGDQPQSLELVVTSTYPGTERAHVALSDVQMFLTPEDPNIEDPAWERSKRDKLRKWKTARTEAAKRFAGKPYDQPVYASYEVAVAKTVHEETAHDSDGNSLESLIMTAETEPSLADLREAFAAGRQLVGAMRSMTPAKITRSSLRLIDVDGLVTPTLQDIASGWFEGSAVSLPIRSDILLATSLSIVDQPKRRSLEAFETAKDCQGDEVWVARSPADRERPSQLRALAVGKCGWATERGGRFRFRTVELYVYDARGRLALALAPGHLRAFTWSDSSSNPRIVHARAYLPWQDQIVTATKRVGFASL